MKCNIQSSPVEEWEWTVEEIVDAQKNEHLQVNSEYQRGAVWTVPQMRMLVDSMLRGYYIPLIYLRRVKHETNRTMSSRHEIIDGQQRINAICSFVDGYIVQGNKLQTDTHGSPREFGSLYDSRERDRKRFPSFLHGQPCWWSGKKFRTNAKGMSFTSDEQRRFLDTKISVAVIECEDNEARDMFIRLQSGSDLKAQEKRDAWPGNFCEIILDVGGKINDRRPGHPFFARAVGLPKKDRGETRELAAQMLMVFLKKGELQSVSLAAEALNDCYREYVGLDSNSPEVKRFYKILDCLGDAFSGNKHLLKNKKPYAIHLMLLADMLLDDARDKMKGIADALKHFIGEVNKAGKEKILPSDADDDTRQLWEFFGYLRGRGTTSKALASRHDIFVRQMSRLLGASLAMDALKNTNPTQILDNPKTKPLAKVESSMTIWPIRDLIDERKGENLLPNPEYQRAPVWNLNQRRLLVDSVLRGYQIPLIYLHKVQGGVQHAKLGGSEQVRFEIVDGQQRIDSFDYFQGGIIPEAGSEKTKPFGSLLNPSEKPDADWFPDFIQRKPCAWGGKTYSGLTEEQKKEFLDKNIAVVEVGCEPESARDMFIRLQGGTPLKPQEVRDAWPGNFCSLVLGIGGKPNSQYGLGHDFFRTKVKVTGVGGIGKRQLVAQLLMLYLSRKQNNAAGFVTVDRDKLDGYYRSQVGLDLGSDEVRRFRAILGKLLNLFSGENNPPMKSAEVIHLVLFADTLMNNYVPLWEETIAKAHAQFTQEADKASSARRRGETEGIAPEFVSYSEDVARNTTKAASIRRRHEVYVRAMSDFMGDSIKLRDKKRIYTADDKDVIFYRDKQKCYKCGGTVQRRDADIHHVIHHGKGGDTTLENGVLMHRECHQDLHKQKGGTRK